jgi:class 3 adenylate cyclase
MACAGLKACLSTKKFIYNDTRRALDLALDMMDVVETLRWGQNNRVILKIGIHYGPVIAGVIGYHKPQFSLIGDTINTTSRVCSTGLDDKITIS